MAGEAEYGWDGRLYIYEVIASLRAGGRSFSRRISAPARSRAKRTRRRQRDADRRGLCFSQQTDSKKTKSDQLQSCTFSADDSCIIPDKHFKFNMHACLQCLDSTEEERWPTESATYRRRCPYLAFESAPWLGWLPSINLLGSSQSVIRILQDRVNATPSTLGLTQVNSPPSNFWIPQNDTYLWTHQDCGSRDVRGSPSSEYAMLERDS